MNYTKQLALNGIHEIKHIHTDYYHVLPSGRQVRLSKDVALTLIEIVAIDHGRDCTSKDSSGRLCAKWEIIDAEPVEELEEWLTR